MLYTLHANNFYTRKRFISNNEIYEKVMKTYVQFLFFVFVLFLWNLKVIFFFVWQLKLKKKIYMYIYTYTKKIINY